MYYIYNPQQNQEFTFGKEKKLGGLENYLVRKYITMQYEEKMLCAFSMGYFPSNLWFYYSFCLQF